MRKFGYLEFNDDYGMVFDIEKYSDEEAIKITAREWNCSENDLEVVEYERVRYCRIAPKWAQNEGMNSGYFTGETVKGSFPVVVVNFRNKVIL